MTFFKKWGTQNFSYRLVAGGVGAMGVAAYYQHNRAHCFPGFSNPPTASNKYKYPDNPNVTTPSPIVNSPGTSIEEFFKANPSMVNLTRICADLSNIIYCVTDFTHSSKELLASEMLKYAKYNPLLSQLELVDSWRDGAIYKHQASKLLFCVARGTETRLKYLIENPNTALRDLSNNAQLATGGPAHNRLMSFKERVRNARKSYPDYMVLTTGHSLGGAVAHDYALFAPEVYSIVFSPGGGIQGDRRYNNNDTWPSSNPNIVAFKPSNDIITRFFDCPGIVIQAAPTGHSILDNPLTSALGEVPVHVVPNKSDSEDNFSDSPSPVFDNWARDTDELSVKTPSTHRSEQSSQRSQKASDNGEKTKEPPPVPRTVGTAVESMAIPVATVSQTPASKSAPDKKATPRHLEREEIGGKIYYTPSEMEKIRQVTEGRAQPSLNNPTPGSMPLSEQEIEKERKTLLAASRSQYYEEKHQTKSMPRSAERKEIIAEKQEQRHRRDAAINQEANEQRAISAITRATQAVETSTRESSSKTTNDRSSSDRRPSLFAATVVTAATVVAARQQSNSERGREGQTNHDSTFHVRVNSKR